mgnify:CR=1 FL=1
MLTITPIRADEVTLAYPYADGISLTIRRWGNDEFLAKWRRLQQPYRRQIDAGRLPAEKSRELLCQAMAGTVLVGWSGVPVEYSVESAADLLLSDRDARDWGGEQAQEVGNFLDDAQERLEGNS